MLSWLWDTLFGDDVEEYDDTVSVSMANINSIAADMSTLQHTIAAAKESLAATEKNTRLFYQSIEALMMESFDTTNEGAEVSPESDGLHEMRAALEEQRSTIVASMIKQKDAVEARLFRAQVQLHTLGKQKKCVEASARQLDNPLLHCGHVTYPAPVTLEFSTNADDQK
jgi:chromosome segregation ATPase